MGRFGCVILDVDGTLVDSNDAHARSWAEVFQEGGYPVTYRRVRKLIGMGSDKLLAELTGLSKDSPRGKELVERRKRLFTERYLPRIRALPGSRELLLHMRSQGLCLVVASSAEADELRSLLDIAGASDLVDHRTSASDAEHSKPDPDIVRAALSSSGCDHAHAVMLGDTPYDVEAAARTRVSTIALRSGGWEDRDLHGAIAVYDDPADLLAHYDRSPLGESPQ